MINLKSQPRGEAVIIYEKDEIVYRRFLLPGITGALALSMIFHALYNLLVSEPGITSVIGYALPLVTAAAPVLPYRRLVAEDD